MAEIAVLELELDASDFQEGMQEASESVNAFEGISRSSINKVIGIYRQFYEFLKTGSGETAASIKRLEERVDSLSRRAATAAGETGGVRALVRSFDELTKSIERVPGAIEGVGAAIAVLVTGTVGQVAQLIQMFSDLADVTQGRLPGSVQGRVDQARLLLAEQRQIGVGFGLAARATAVAETGTRAAAAFEARRTPARRGGGGGGGGGRAEGPADFEFTETESEEALALITGVPTDEQFSDALERLSTFGEEKISFDQMLRAEERAIEQERAEGMREQVDRRREMAEQEAAIDQQRLAAAGQYVSIAGNFGKQLAGIAGASAAAQHLITGTTETVLAAVAWAKVAAPFGQIHIPEALAHTAAAVLAFAAAAAPSGGGRGGGRASGGGGGGGGGPRGAGAGFAAPGGGGGTGGATYNITINQGWPIASKRDAEDGIVAALKGARNRGERNPWERAQ